MSCRHRLKSIVAHLRAQLPATTLLLAGLLPRGFAGDRTGQWQTRRPGVDERDWPNPFSQVRVISLHHKGRLVGVLSINLTVGLDSVGWPSAWHGLKSGW